jgi:hypothetical protein
MNELELLQSITRTPDVIEEILRHKDISKTLRAYFEEVFLQLLAAQKTKFCGLIGIETRNRGYGHNNLLLTYPSIRTIIERKLKMNDEQIRSSLVSLEQTPPPEDFKLYLDTYEDTNSQLEFMLLMPAKEEYKDLVAKAFITIQQQELAEYKKESSERSYYYGGFSALQRLVGEGRQRYNRDSGDGAAFKAPNGLYTLAEVAENVMESHSKTTSIGSKESMRDILQHARLTPECYKKLWTDTDNPLIRGALAANESMPEDFVEMMAKYRDKDIMHGFVQNSKCPEFVLIKYTQSDDQRLATTARERLKVVGEKLLKEEGQ